MSEEQFQKVANKDDLKEGAMLKVEANGKQIVLSMVEGKVYAVDEICTHEGGPLHEGELNGYDLKCPWHYAVFDVRNGKVSDATVSSTNLNSYVVKIDETNRDTKREKNVILEQEEVPTFFTCI